MTEEVKILSRELDKVRSENAQLKKRLAKAEASLWLIMKMVEPRLYVRRD